MIYRPLLSRSNQALFVLLATFSSSTTRRGVQAFTAFSINNNYNNNHFPFAFLQNSQTPTSNRNNRRYFSTASSEEAMTKKQVLVPIADGSEEIETTCITDTLTRFGAHVTIASVNAGGQLECKMSRGIKFLADCAITDPSIAATEWDLIVLPGGMPGAEHLRDCVPLMDLVQKQKDSGKWYGAICAAPAVALASKNLIEPGATATCYPAPAFVEKLDNRLDEPVVVYKNMVTSQGPGTALHFALQLGEELFGKEARDTIAKQMLVH